MSNSIFKEVAFTPHIFQKENLLHDERKFERLLNILDNLAESGQIIGVFSDWFRFMNENISQFDEFDKDDIEEILKFLNNRQRIVHVSKKCNSNDENCWIDQALILNSIRSFEFILATKDRENIKSFNDIDRKIIKTLHYKGAIVAPQSKDNMQRLLAPILAYAEIVKIYDPYFNFALERYESALNIIANALGFKHSEKELAIIEIHTSIKVFLDRDNLINWKIGKQYSDKIIKFEKIFGHSIKFYIWEDKHDNKWHDRWIVTNQCAVSLGKGSDVSEWTDATWGLLDYNQIPNVEKNFYTNRAEYNLIAIIDKNGVNQENKSLQYREPKSADEIEKKLANVKNFSKR